MHMWNKTKNKTAVQRQYNQIRIEVAEVRCWSEGTIEQQQQPAGISFAVETISCMPHIDLIL